MCQANPSEWLVGCFHHHLRMGEGDDFASGDGRPRLYRVRNAVGGHHRDSILDMKKVLKKGGYGGGVV